jgi:AbiV family abortive infection protein
MGSRSKRTRRREASAFLTTEQIAYGMQLCIKSAHDLYTGGVVLDAQNIKPLARALLILAIEEYGKIGWLYLTLTLPEGSDPNWPNFWRGFYSHEAKNEVGREMTSHESTGNFLPVQVHFFRHPFPFFTVPPALLDREKQAMLYVDFDSKGGRFVSPGSYFEFTRDWSKVVLPMDYIKQQEQEELQKAPNRGLIRELETLVRYVARNAEAHVFDKRVLAAYREFSGLVEDEQDRVYFLQLFFQLILRKPSGYQVDRPVDTLATLIRQRHPKEIDSLLERWTALGNVLAASSRA